MEWATVSENSKHAWETGLIDLRGERSGMAVLTYFQAMEIKYDYRDMSNSEVAKIYGVSRAVVYAIRIGKSWAHI